MTNLAPIFILFTGFVIVAIFAHPVGLILMIWGLLGLVFAPERGEPRDLEEFRSDREDYNENSKATYWWGDSKDWLDYDGNWHKF